MWSQSAENLILGTIAQESRMGKYVRQKGGGPACGIPQIEPATAADVIYRYLAARPDIEAKFNRGFQLVNSSTLDWSQVDLNAVATKLLTDNAFAVAVCRIKYLLIPEALPAADDIEGMARYWKRFYNSPLGAGRPEEFIENYHRYVGES